MKTVLTLASALVLSSNIFAAESAPFYYAAQFEVESVRPMCPRTVPTGAVCMGIGSVVTLKATIGCGDSLLFTEVEDQLAADHSVDLYAVSVVKRHPRHQTIRCVRPNVVKTTVTVPYNTINYNLINLGVENQ